MNARLTFTLVSIHVLATAISLADSYTNNLATGYSFIANQLDHGSNTLAELFPNMPDGGSLVIYSRTSCDVSNTYAYDSGAGGWIDEDLNPVDPGSVALVPGDGARFFNPGPGTTMVFTGTPHVPVLPVALPCGYGHSYVLSRQTNDLGTYENITGLPPDESARLERWNGSGFTVHTYTNGAWSPGPPSVNVGESVVVFIPTATPHALWLTNLLPCVSSPVIANLGALRTVFVPNLGQLDGTVQFQMLALQSGNLFFAEDGIRFLLNAGADTNQYPQANLLQQYVGGPLTLESLAPLPSFTTYVGPGSPPAVTQATNYAALRAPALASGITADFGGTLRKLEITYTVSPGADPSQILWHYPGATNFAARPSGVMEFQMLVAGGRRSFLLGPPEAWQQIGTNRVAVAAGYTVAGGHVGFALGSHATDQPLLVRSELLHSPFVQDYGTAQGSNRVVVAGGTFGAVLQSGVLPTGDAFVAAIDEAGLFLAWTTLIQAGASDRANGVAVAGNGNIVVAGTTDSPDFPLVTPAQTNLAGGSDAFVMTLSASGDTVSQSTYFGSTGDDTGDDVVVDDAGTLGLVGRTDASFPGSNPQAASYSLVLPTPPARLDQTCFIAQLSATSSVVFSDRFTAPRLPRLRVWWRCVNPVGQQAQLAAGSPARGATTTECGDTFEYTISHYTDDYLVDHDFFAPASVGLGYPPGGWGYHALRWRYYSDEGSTDPAWDPGWYNSKPHTVDWNLALPDISVIPKIIPIASDAGVLNTLETQVYLDSIAAGGAPRNPRGGWAGGHQTDREELLLIASITMWRYGGAAYTHANVWDSLANSGSGAWTQLGWGIDKVTWKVVCAPNNSYNGEHLEDLCDFAGSWAGSWVGNIGCALAIGGNGWHIEADQVGTWVWGARQTWAGPSGAAAYPIWWYEEWYEAGDYVVDPDEEGADGIDKLQEVAAQLSPLTVVNVPFTLTERSSGAITGTGYERAYVPASSLRLPGPSMVTPTVLVTASASCASNQVTLLFSQALDAASADTSTNYALSGLSVLGATLRSNALMVDLSTSALSAGTPHTLTVNGVRDRAGNPVAPNSQITVSCPATDLPAQTLVAHLAGGQLVLLWSDLAVLEEASNVTGPWLAVPGASSGFTVEPATPRKFFRLRFP